MDRGRRYWKTPMAKKRVGLRRWLIVILACVLIVSLAELTAYFIRSHNNRTEQALLAQQHEAALTAEQTTVTEEPSAETALPTTPVETHAAAVLGITQKETETFFQVIGLTSKALKPFVRQNGDTVGWITIQDVVDQPVVYRDNSYYVTHDFYGKRNSCGAVFLDEGHPLRANAQNLLLYGHNMKDGSMFGRLAKYLSDNYLHSHYTVQLETRIESFTYYIFAVDRVSTDTQSRDFLFFWGHPSFADSDTFEDYIDEVYRKSTYSRYLDVAATDTLLTLSTCMGDERLVLLARRQRVNETDADIQRALLGLYPV